MARPFQLTSFPPGTTVYVVEKHFGNEHMGALERTPNVRIPSATVPRPPNEVGEIVAEAITDDSGTATFSGLRPRGGLGRRGAGIPQRRYWAFGLVAGEWRRVSFSTPGWDDGPGAQGPSTIRQPSGPPVG
jgi:hypothetical protein